MEIQYCKRWSRRRKTMLQELSVEQARNAHEKGVLYGVLLSQDGCPYCFVEARLEVKYLAVKFFDKQSRPYLTYIFGDSEDRGQLF